jgi:N utilization substance protein B
MKSKTRRQAREAALQSLYALEVGKARLADTIKNSVEQSRLEGDQAQFARDLVTGVFEKQIFLDELLAPLVTEWDFDRVAVIDRNVLRLAAYELFFCPGIPPVSSIDEAIELAKKFSTAESGKFVNGVLGKLLASSPKAEWDPALTALPPESKEEKVDVEPAAAEADGSADASAVGLWKLRSQEESK